MSIISSFLSVTICAYSVTASNSCYRMTSVQNVKANLSKCKTKAFLFPVPTYFCIEYCDGLPDCSAVIKEMGEMTSWCCAYKIITGGLSVCHGNYTLIHLPNMKLLWQNDRYCSGKSNVFLLHFDGFYSISQKS